MKKGCRSRIHRNGWLSSGTGRSDEYSDGETILTHREERPDHTPSSRIANLAFAPRRLLVILRPSPGKQERHQAREGGRYGEEGHELPVAAVSIGLDGCNHSRRHCSLNLPLHSDISDRGGIKFDSSGYGSYAECIMALKKIKLNSYNSEKVVFTRNRIPATQATHASRFTSLADMSVL